MSTSLQSASRAWWQGAIIYQIYPRSFMDANGDGMGDLPGITEKIPYVAGLGVDAIWLSPFFMSPMRDAGYDISDYRAVDPIFGTLRDFDDLLQVAHQHGLKVLIDLVLSHTSNLHPWFLESSQSRANPKADWYTWADPKPDGTPPNNWLSHFGGSSWTWSARRRQYYFHNFLPEQPDLNYHNPQVRQAILEVAKFWLDRGVDGFRLDTVNMYFQDRLLRDNPPCPRAQIVDDFETYEYQVHLYDKTQPENLAFLEDLRRLTDLYPDKTLLGELGVESDSAGPLLASYTTAGKRLHMAYVFALMLNGYSAAKLRGVVERLNRDIADGWIAWTLANHDVERMVSRWEFGGDAKKAAPMLFAFLFSLRGTACLYQGEELGLTEAKIPFELIQDPHGRAMWPENPGRDGCRTPFVWHGDLPNGGFSEAEPWLPVPREHLPLAVNCQEGVADSILERVRKFIAWRKRFHIFQTGGMRFLDDSAGEILALLRFGRDEELLAVFNFGDKAESYHLPEGFTALTGHGFEDTAVCEDGWLTLAGYGAYFAKRER